MTQVVVSKLKADSHLLKLCNLVHTKFKAHPRAVGKEVHLDIPRHESGDPCLQFYVLRVGSINGPNGAIPIDRNVDDSEKLQGWHYDYPMFNEWVSSLVRVRVKLKCRGRANRCFFFWTLRPRANRLQRLERT